MNIKDLLRDDDAVSPVIGVILMVAITVILAAVIGTFVLGLGDQVQSSAPNANFQFEYDGDTDGIDGGTANDAVTVTHNGGQDIELDNIIIQIGGQVAYENSGVATGYNAGTPTFSGDTISTGSAQEIVETSDTGSNSVEANDDVRVIWESPSGDSSNTIGSSTVPS